MADRLGRRSVELVPDEECSRAAAELPRELARLADELERGPGRAAVADLDDRPGVVGRGGLLGDMAGLVPGRQGRLELGQAASTASAASSQLPTRLPARSGVTSRTARTRVGDPVWPKRLSFSATSSTRSAAVQTSMRPSPGSTSISSARATETTAGSSTVIVSSRSSVSRRIRSRPSASSTSSALVTCGRSRWAATSGGTCQVSESTVLRPVRTRSTPPSFSSASPMVRDVPRVSATAKTRSDRWIARSAPSASVSRSASSACGGPIVIATTSPPERSRSANGLAGRPHGRTG